MRRLRVEEPMKVGGRGGAASRKSKAFAAGVLAVLTPYAAGDLLWAPLEYGTSVSVIACVLLSLRLGTDERAERWAEAEALRGGLFGGLAIWFGLFGVVMGSLS